MDHRDADARDMQRRHPFGQFGGFHWLALHQDRGHQPVLDAQSDALNSGFEIRRRGGYLGRQQACAPQP